MSEVVDRPVTIYDVAREAGVSPSTVSRTFSRPYRVNATTANYIHEVAARIGYRARTARTPDLSGNQVLGLLVTDIANPYYGLVTRGVQDVAIHEDYTLQLIDTLESEDRERKALRRTTGVDGLILTSPLTSDKSILAAAHTRPVVLVNRLIRGVPSVIVDNVGGTRMAVDYLAELGHQEILFIAGPEESWVGGIRWRALQERATELGITARRIGHYTATVEGGFAAAKEVREHPHVAVIAHNDLMALGLMRGLQQAGCSVPKDTCIVGFDNIPACRVANPSLTSVAAPLRDLGAAATRLLLDLLAGNATTETRIVLPSKLVIRDSATCHSCPPGD